MELAARLENKLDEGGKLAWIAAMVLGFIVFWPVGLAILFYMIWSGRMGCSARRTAGRWHNAYKARGGWRHDRHNSASSGNHAFDEYREETLRRLEEEQTEFQDFLERLRHAKDKAEFDNFMADRKRRPSGPESAEGPAPA
jgi:hypothetical protein